MSKKKKKNKLIKYLGLGQKFDYKEKRQKTRDLYYKNTTYIF